MTAFFLGRLRLVEFRLRLFDFWVNESEAEIGQLSSLGAALANKMEPLALAEIPRLGAEQLAATLENLQLSPDTGDVRSTLRSHRLAALSDGSRGQR